MLISTLLTLLVLPGVLRLCLKGYRPPEPHAEEESAPGAAPAGMRPALT
jgi:hypothetical protein